MIRPTILDAHSEKRSPARMTHAHHYLARPTREHRIVDPSAPFQTPKSLARPQHAQATYGEQNAAQKRHQVDVLGPAHGDQKRHDRQPIASLEWKAKAPCFRL